VTDVIKVDIWSDIQCPWCYIGKRKFELGVAAADVPVAVEYHSFELAPDTPVDFDGSPADYLARRGFPRSQVGQMLDRATGIAASVGLEYHFDRAHQTNTIRAHELIHFAKAEGRQIDMVERLFRAYFTDGGHVGRVEQLVDLAGDVGLDRDEAEQALLTNTYLPAVKADIRQAARYGISGVPFFVFNETYGVSGAQEPETFAAVLEQVRTAQAAA
jgi:predicted DsbA family dithiol-disulfide isomerase